MKAVPFAFVPIPDPSLFLSKYRSQIQEIDASRTRILGAQNVPGRIFPDPKIIQNLAINQTNSLRHELSRYMPQNKKAYVRSARDTEERRLLDLWITLEAKGESLTNKIIKCHQNVFPNTTGIRQTNLSTAPDQNARIALYASPHKINTEINRLDQVCASYLPISRTAAALVSMVSLTSIHPFSDGNGRVSRVLFNALFWKGEKYHPYISIGAISDISSGGFLLGVRSAQRRGDWSHLLHILSTTLSWHS